MEFIKYVFQMFGFELEIRGKFLHIISTNNEYKFSPQDITCIDLSENYDPVRIIYTLLPKEFLKKVVPFVKLSQSKYFRELI